MSTDDIGRPQWLGKPAGIFQQRFYFAGHVAFLQVIDHASELLPARFGHIGKDVQFGHAAGIIIDRGLTARRHDIKANGMRLDMAVRGAASNSMRRYPAIIVFAADLLKLWVSAFPTPVLDGHDLRERCKPSTGPAICRPLHRYGNGIKFSSALCKCIAA